MAADPQGRTQSVAAMSFKEGRSPLAGRISRKGTMAVTPKPSPPMIFRHIWHTPTARTALYWFLFAISYCAIFYILYFVLFKAPIFTGPWFDRVFRCGVMAYIMILAVAAYSLRTRFIPGLPWK